MTRGYKEDLDFRALTYGLVFIINDKNLEMIKKLVLRLRSMIMQYLRVDMWITPRVLPLRSMNLISLVKMVNGGVFE